LGKSFLTLTLIFDSWQDRDLGPTIGTSISLTGFHIGSTGVKLEHIVVAGGLECSSSVFVLVDGQSTQP
jgi:hypothetical protein